MFGRTLVRIIAALAIVGLLTIIGINVYNAGVSEGLAEAARSAAAAGDQAPVVVPPYVGGYGYGGWHYGGWGFGFFGILFWIFGIFLVFALLRAAFGWGRWGGHRGGPDGHGGHGWDDRRRRLEELHRDLHREDQASSAPGA